MSTPLEPPGVGIARRQFVRRAGGLVLASSFGGNVIAACGGDDGQRTQEVGGTLRTFNYAGYDDKDIAAPFLKKNDVTLKSAPINNPDEILTKLKAGGTKQFDLVSPNAAQAPELVAADLLQEVDYSQIPRTEQYLPNMASLGPETFAVDGTTYVAPYIWGINGLIYNKASVAETPESWEDLLRPEYKGKLVLFDTAADNVATWSRVLGFDYTRLTRAQLDELTDFLIDLKKSHVKTFAGSYDDVADQLTRGDLWAVATATWIAVPQLAKVKGAGAKDVTWTLPKEGGVTWIDGWVIPKDAPNPATAHAFVNYMLGKKQQAALAEKFTSGTVVKDAVPLLSAEAKQIYPYDDFALLEDKAPVYEFPPPEAEVQISDWTKAWTRVQAA
ncbi:MAG: ABC transporter substrate-binding protein [Gammaproteobacteria bacterium]